MTLSGVVGEADEMSLYDDNYTNVGSPTGLFIQTSNQSGSTRLITLERPAWRVEAGELISVRSGSNLTRLYEVVGVHDADGGVPSGGSSRFTRSWQRPTTT